jgi:predicted nuclease of predicted toxin-antitoxin system
MKLLVDENLSPTLVPRLGALGIAARHIVHVGKAGRNRSGFVMV